MTLGILCLRRKTSQEPSQETCPQTHTDMRARGDAAMPKSLLFPLTGLRPKTLPLGPTTSKDRIRDRLSRAASEVTVRRSSPEGPPAPLAGRRTPAADFPTHRHRDAKPARRHRGRPSLSRLRDPAERGGQKLGLVLFFLLVSACRWPLWLMPSAPTRIVTDELGRRVELSVRPRRIISLAPSVTEMLFALGVGDRVVGVTSLCDYPPEATMKEKVGDVMTPSLERIVALAPDLVIISTATQLELFAKRLIEIGVPVYVVKANRLEDVLATLRHLGDVTGEVRAAEALTRSLQARIERVVERTRTLPRPRVLLVVQRDPLIVAGREAFLTDLVEKAGGRSITADAQREWTLYSLESVLARAPEVIVIPSHETQSQRLPNLQWSALADTPALRNKRVYTINADLLMRPGPRLVEGLEELARLLHPEAFQ